MEMQYKMKNQLDSLYTKMHEIVCNITHKKNNYTLLDLENVMSQKFDLEKIELHDINRICKPKYKLYHKKCNTPLLVSEEMILDDDYCGTYLIHTGIDDCSSKKDSIYVDTAFMIASKDKKCLSNYFLFNGTYEISLYLEILCNFKLEDIKERYM